MVNLIISTKILEPRLKKFLRELDSFYWEAVTQKNSVYGYNKKMYNIYFLKVKTIIFYNLNRNDMSEKLLGYNDCPPKLQALIQEEMIHYELNSEEEEKPPSVQSMIDHAIKFNTPIGLLFYPLEGLSSVDFWKPIIIDKIIPKKFYSEDTRTDEEKRMDIIGQNGNTGEHYE